MLDLDQLYQHLDSTVSELQDGLVNKLHNSLLIKRKHIQKSRELDKYLFLSGRCQAKTSNGQECSRRSVSVISNYCHCHVDNPDKYLNAKPKVSKNKPVIDPSKIVLDEYVRCQFKTINGTQCLVDKNRILFDKRDFTILGRIVDGEVERFDD